MANNKLFGNLTKGQKKNLNSIFWRSGLVDTSWNHAVGAGLAFYYTMRPILDELYANDDEERHAAYKRNMEYFNTNYTLFGFVVGIIYSMEEQRATKGELTGEAISAVRIALGGPLAAIGDTLTQSVIRIIVASMTMGMAMEGNVLGPILFFVVYALALLVLDYGGVFLGYTLGTSLIDKLFEGGLLDTFTKAVGALGLFAVGALSASAVRLNFKLEIGTLNLQSALDSILPGLVPLLMVLGVMMLIKKKVGLGKIIWGLFLMCFVLAFVGLI